MSVSGVDGGSSAYAVEARVRRRGRDDDDKALTAPGARALTPQQQDVVARLQKRDTEVHAHEAAHQAAAGAAGGGASFTYTTGPDGKRYATGGEVPVQLVEGRTPEETIRNARQVRAAALAPADPSSQDRAVAAQASALESQAEQQLSDERVAALKKTSDGGGSAGPSAANGDGDVVTRVANERQAAMAGWQHLHSDDGCPFCARAAAVYGGAK